MRTRGKCPILVLTIAITLLATGCIGHVSSGVEYDTDNYDCAQAAEIDNDYNDVLAELGELEETDVNAENPTYTQEQVDGIKTSLEATIADAELRADNAESSAAYAWLQRDGLQEEYRTLQDKYGALVSQSSERDALCELYGVWQEIEGEEEEQTDEEQGNRVNDLEDK